MALLTPTTIAPSELKTITVSAAAAAGGDTVTWKPNRTQFLLVKNADGSNHTVSIAVVTPTVVAGVDIFTIPAIAHLVTAGTVAIIPMTRAYADASNVISITYDAVTNVTVRLIEMEL